jgi:hypothetical protein
MRCMIQSKVKVLFSVGIRLCRQIQYKIICRSLYNKGEITNGRKSEIGPRPIPCSC